MSTIDDFRLKYAQLSDDELIRLFSLNDTLREEASEALNEELRRRKLNYINNEAGDEQSSPSTIPQTNESRGAGRIRYIGLAILLLLTAGSIAVNAFTILSYINHVPDKGAESFAQGVGKQLLPWAVMITWASSIWKGILNREAGPNFSSVHRRFGLYLGTAVVIVIAAGIGLGLWNSGRIARADRIRQIASDMNVVRSQSLELGRRLSAIRSRETPTFRDYYEQCNEVERLLNEAAPTRKRVRDLLRELQELTSSDPTYRSPLDNLAVYFEKDDAAIRDLEMEISHSKKLMTLPSSAQSAYYKEHVVPLQEDERRIADEELAIKERTLQR